MRTLIARSNNLLLQGVLITVQIMKMHLPLLLRCLLIESLIAPVTATLTWNSGDWNTTDESWLSEDSPSVFSNGDSVAFTAAAENATVTITEIVEPAGMLVNAPGFVFTGHGSIAGAGGLTLAEGGTLKVENSNAFSGGTENATGCILEMNQYNSLGTTNPDTFAFGPLSGAGEVIINLESSGTQGAIIGNLWQEMRGVLYVKQGNVGLGKNPEHRGAGAYASLGASQINVGADGKFFV